jgi:hypothetical protein
VRKSYEATFGFWSELKVTQKDGPHIQISGGVACADGITLAAGKPETGDPIAGTPTFEMMVLENAAIVG